MLSRWTIRWVKNAPRTPGQPAVDPNEITLAMTHGMIKADQAMTFSIPLEDQRSGVIAIRVHAAGDDTWAAGGGQTFVRPPSR